VFDTISFFSFTLKPAMKTMKNQHPSHRKESRLEERYGKSACCCGGGGFHGDDEGFESEKSTKGRRGVVEMEELQM
jgi:hypothetical protein